jgi:hypothetical protein
MPKIITARRLEGEHEQAKEYVKAHILFPSGLLGLILMIAGTASLVYQFFALDYGWETFVQSSGLLVVGGLLGWGQTRYHQYVLREHPEYFAARLRLFTRSRLRRPKKDAQLPALAHRGRKLVPLGYVLGAALLFGVSALSAMVGRVYFMAALLMPWAGFFWAKMFFWRGVLVAKR